LKIICRFLIKFYENLAAKKKTKSVLEVYAGRERGQSSFVNFWFSNFVEPCWPGILKTARLGLEVGSQRLLGGQLEFLRFWQEESGIRIRAERHYNLLDRE